MTPVPAKTRKLFQFFLIVTNGHLPHFCPTFNMAALLPKRSILRESYFVVFHLVKIEYAFMF